MTTQTQCTVWRHGQVSTRIVSEWPTIQELGAFGKRYAVTQDLRCTVGAIRELDLHFDFARGITDPEETGSVTTRPVSVGF